MVDVLKEIQKLYGDITIGELINILDKPKEETYHYWLWYSHFGNGEPYILSSKKDWEMINCEDTKDAEIKIKKFIEEDEKNGIKSIYKKKEGGE